MDKNSAYRKIPGVYLCQRDFGDLYSCLKFFNKVYSCYDAEITVLLRGIEELFANEFTDSNLEEACRELANPRHAGRKPSCSEQDIEKIHRLRSEGLTIREIARKTGFSKSVVQRKLSESLI